MTPQEIQKIERFGERIPDHLTDHWNEIIDIINTEQPQDNGLEISILIEKLKEAVKGFLILKLWVKEGKLKKRHAFDNFVDVFVDRLKLN